MIFHVDHEQFQINQRYEYQFANDSNYWEAMVRRCGPGTCRLLNALWIYALNTCLVLQSETCWHSRRVLRIGNERRDLFAVSVNQFRRYIYEREREKGAESITYIFIFQKEIDSYVHRNWYVGIAGFGRVLSFFFSLWKRQTRRYNG